MNKSFKRFISTMLVACMAMSMVAGAAGTDEAREAEVTLAFREVISGFYTDTKNEYTVLDRVGSDITQDFYNQNYSLFIEGNFKQIYDNANGSISRISRRQETTIETRASGDVTRNVKETNYELCYSTDGKWQKEIIYDVSGKYIYNTTSRRITFAANPTLQMQAYTWGDAFTPRIENNDARQLVASDGQSVIFSYFFRMKSGFNASGSYYQLDFGTHGYTFKANA